MHCWTEYKFPIVTWQQLPHTVSLKIHESVMQERDTFSLLYNLSTAQRSRHRKPCGIKWIFFIIITFQKAEAMFWETIKNVIPKKASSTDHLGDLLTNSSALLQESYTERGNSARFWGPFCPCTSGFYLSITLPLKNSSLYSFPPWMCDKYAFGHIR